MLETATFIVTANINIYATLKQLKKMAQKQERKEITRIKDFRIIEFKGIYGYSIYEIEKKHWFFKWKWNIYQHSWFLDLDVAKDYLKELSKI